MRWQGRKGKKKELNLGSELMGQNLAKGRGGSWRRGKRMSINNDLQRVKGGLGQIKVKEVGKGQA